MINKRLLRLFVTAIAAADSIGATTEFDSEMMAIGTWGGEREKGFPFRSVGGGWLNIPVGAHTDDTDMTLCIVKSFLAKKETFDVADIAARWVAWLNSAPPDICTTTRAALARVRAGEDPYEAGYHVFAARPGGEANGSLMRNGIVGLLAGTLDEAFEFSLTQGIVTHYHPLPALCCAVQAWLVWELLDGRWPFQAYEDWMEAFHTAWVEWVIRCAHPAVRLWLKRVEKSGYLSRAMDELVSADFGADTYSPFDIKDFTARAGHCLLTLQIAIWCLQWSKRPASTYKMKLPGIYPAAGKVFKRRGHFVLGWPALLGRDADTYGATAAPLVAAAMRGRLPKCFFQDLAVLKEDWLFCQRRPA